MNKSTYVVWDTPPFITDDINIVLESAKKGLRIFDECFFMVGTTGERLGVSHV
jgi:hypothetical protein